MVEKGYLVGGEPRLGIYLSGLSLFGVQLSDRTQGRTFLLVSRQKCFVGDIWIGAYPLVAPAYDSVYMVCEKTFPQD